VVFDFDGLMVDTEWAIYESARAAFAVHGHELTAAAWATIVGLGDDDDDLAWTTLMAAMALEGFDRAVFSATYAAQDRSDRDTLPLLPGVATLVDSLHVAGVPLGIASSSSRAWLERHTSRLGVAFRWRWTTGSWSRLPARSCTWSGSPEPAISKCYGAS
jgi:putative hydrolase of the HAD superfamily